MIQKAIEQFEFEISKEFSFIDENPKMKEFYDLAINALKKQIPMKVRSPIDANGQYNKLVIYCYSCGKTVRDMKYCYNCGQRLDWEI